MVRYFEFKIFGYGLTVYRVGDSDRKFMWNDYPGKRIGAAIVTGPICWSLVWGKL